MDLDPIPEQNVSTYRFANPHRESDSKSMGLNIFTDGQSLNKIREHSIILIIMI